VPLGSRLPSCPSPSLPRGPHEPYCSGHPLALWGRLLWQVGTPIEEQPRLAVCRVLGYRRTQTDLSTESAGVGSRPESLARTRRSRGFPAVRPLNVAHERIPPRSKFPSVVILKSGPQTDTATPQPKSTGSIGPVGISGKKEVLSWNGVPLMGSRSAMSRAVRLPA